MGCVATKTCIKCRCPMTYYDGRNGNNSVSNMNCQVHRQGVIKGLPRCTDCGKRYIDGGNCKHAWKPVWASAWKSLSDFVV